MNQYIRSGTKQLRLGFTTGACAAMAGYGAVCLFLTGKLPDVLTLTAGDGTEIYTSPEDGGREPASAWCAIRKDSGDDPDSTNGCVIRAEVYPMAENEIRIDGGDGIGRVTKPGLDQPVGAAAINSSPRKMIRNSVQAASDEYSYAGGWRVIISAPDGQELAKKTLNASLGIEGGISILGTTGIVRPMSSRALIDTFELEMSQARSFGYHKLVLTPGNYGQTFVQKLNLPEEEYAVVRFSNYLGEALDLSVVHGFSDVLLIGHIGKLVKAAGGIMNTHSSYADCRMELFCAHAAIAGAGTEVCKRIYHAVTTDACLDILIQEGIERPVMASLTESIQRHISKRIDGRLRIGVVVFSNQHGILGISPEAVEIRPELKED